MKKEKSCLDIAEKKTRKIELVADNYELYQFINHFVHKNHNGEYFYDENPLHHPYIEPLPISFPITDSFEIFDIIPWGGWNECPSNSILKEKSKCWHEKYGAEIIKVTHDSLYYKCSKFLDTEDAEILIQDILNFCPGCLEAYEFHSVDHMKEILLSEKTFILWWD